MCTVRGGTLQDVAFPRLGNRDSLSPLTKPTLDSVDDIAEDGQGEWQPHRMFIGEIIDVDDKR